MAVHNIEIMVNNFELKFNVNINIDKENAFNFIAISKLEDKPLDIILADTLAEMYSHAKGDVSSPEIGSFLTMASYLGVDEIYFVRMGDNLQTNIKIDQKKYKKVEVEYEKQFDFLNKFQTA